ncbi:nitrilase-related carbon-nitrogen hydrolase, partial [Nocardia cyriacigeorgica]|uniref:nitrilase-related carbon-nitrogen hydrolase n=1 Tax=Nocardia cyriacigeorgica TaxID=135487 RepID=UPI002456E78C
MQPQNTAATAATGSGRVEVAVVQFAPSTEPSQNLHQLRGHVREAAEAGAQVVVAPEYSMFAISRLDHRVVAVAEPLTGAFVTGLAAVAGGDGVHVVAGVVETTAPGEDRIHNTRVARGPGGTL